MNVREYFAANGSRFSQQDAQVLGPWLEDLGPVTAKEIVAAAVPEDSPAHPHFEWDNERAGHLYREEQARNMARSIIIKVVGTSGEERTIPGFPAIPVSISDASREDGHGRSAPRQYVPFEIVRQDKEKSEWVRQDALNALVAWKRRYQSYLDVYPDFGETFQLVFDAIQDAEDRAA